MSLKIFRLLPLLPLCAAAASETSSPDTILLSEFVVSGVSSRTLPTSSPVSVTRLTLPEGEASSPDLVTTLAHIPGVSSRSTGVGISKPLIRGLGYNRVVVLHDDIRQEGQQWGDEHGLEIDARSVASVEVLRGASALLHGADALAGALMLHSAPPLSGDTISASFSTGYASVNGLLDGSLSLALSRRRFACDVRYSHALAHAYRSPADGRVGGRVGGSQFASHTFSSHFYCRHTWGLSRLDISSYRLTPSMIEGERDDSGRFLTSVFRGDTIAEIPFSSSALRSYRHATPYQQVAHHKVAFHETIRLPRSTLRTHAAWQFNHREEYESPVPHAAPELEFRLHTASLALQHAVPLTARLTLSSSLAVEFQHSANGADESLIPDYRQADAGAALSLEYRLPRLTLSGGLRADFRALRTDSVRPDFHGFSGALGAVYRPADSLDLRLNLSRGFRAPDIAELASDGEHEGAYRYERGNPHLSPERGFEVDLGVAYTFRCLSVEADFFVHRLSGYIYAARMPDATSPDGDLPLWVYTSGAARLLGGEGALCLTPLPGLRLSTGVSYVRGQRLHAPHAERALPHMPPLHFTTDLAYTLFPERTAVFRALTLTLSPEVCGAQHRYLPSTETSSPAYAVWNASVSVDWMRRSRLVLHLIFSVENMADRAYIPHLSRLKNTPVNPLTGQRGIAAPGRNFILRAVIPMGFALRSAR